MQSIKTRFGQKLYEIQSALHQNPETAMHEYDTTALIRREIERLGYDVIDLGMETGVVARLCTGKNGPVIGLRADIDGIEQTEAVDRPDRSKRDGVMHACGHDIHTTGLLGAAMALTAERERLLGDVVLVFQPAEETIAGANAMIAHGLFEKAPMDALFGLHNMPELPVGTVGLRHGTVMAAKDDFNVIVHGKSGHGGLPHQCADPIVAACGIVGALQTIVSRNVSPMETAALSVCSIHGGATSNLIPDEVRLAGSIRTFSEQVQAFMIGRLKHIAAQTAAAYGCTAEVDHYATMLPLVNNEALYPIALKAASDTVGAERILAPETNIASEDFASYTGHLPCLFYFLGSGREGQENFGWHSSRFCGDRDAALWGAALLTNTVYQAQKKLHKN